MSIDDSELPIAASFLEIVNQAQTNELVQIEEKLKQEKQLQEQLRKANGYSLTTSQAFAEDPEKEENEKKRITKAIDKLDSDSKKAAEDKNKENEVKEDDQIPPPPGL